MSEQRADRIHVKAVSRQPGSPSHQQRIEAYVDLLKARGIRAELVHLPQGALAQRRTIRALAEADTVWWHRHLLSGAHVPLLRRSARRLVYDFDDPLPLSSRKGGKPDRTRTRRFNRLCEISDAATVGSAYLQSLAQPRCSDVRIAPMSIDLPDPQARGQRPASEPAERAITLLWLGSKTTQPYLEAIRPALEAVGQSHPHVTLRLVAHEPMAFGPLRVDHRRWSESEQAAALSQCDIGLCPMPDDPWSRGKCPFKVLQYMAHAMAWIGSAVGENLRTAGPPDAPSGLCAADTQTWTQHLAALIDDARLRGDIGRRARAYIEQHHTRDAVAEILAEALRG